MSRARMVMAGACALANTAVAGTALDPASQAELAAAIQDILRTTPELLRRAQQPPTWRDAVDTDLSRIAAASGALFDSTDLDRVGRQDGRADVAVFYDPASADWPHHHAALTALSATHPGLSVTLHPQPDGIGSLATSLEIDVLPSYVLARLILRGDVPVAIIPRYLPDVSPPPGTTD